MVNIATDIYRVYDLVFLNDWYVCVSVDSLMLMTLCVACLDPLEFFVNSYIVWLYLWFREQKPILWLKKKQQLLEQ